MTLCQSAKWLLVHNITHVTPRAVIRNHVQIFECLERIVDLGHKLVIDLSLNLFLRDHESCQAIVSSFLHTLHCVEFAGLGFVGVKSFDQINLGVGTLA